MLKVGFNVGGLRGGSAFPQRLVTPVRQLQPAQPGGRARQTSSTIVHLRDLRTINIDFTPVVPVMRHDNDRGSVEVQIARWTCRIAQLTTHLVQNRKDIVAKRKIIRLEAKRKKYLKILWDLDKDRYKFVLKTLKLPHIINIRNY